MQAISWPSVLFYCAFGIFIFYQQLHIRKFHGASQAVLLALNISVTVGMLTGLAYLIYYGWSVVWWAPILIFLIGLVTPLFGFWVERLVGAFALSLAAFVGWPVCAFFMFKFMPASL